MFTWYITLQQAMMPLALCGRWLVELFKPITLSQISASMRPAAYPVHQKAHSTIF